TLDDPLATTTTVAWGINDLGQIVGYYVNATGDHGFLYSGGFFTTIDDPFASDASTTGFIHGTHATGINNNGQNVGQYPDKNDRYHGFLETTVSDPPPPAGTTADMILRGSNTSPAVAGQYEIYDTGNNAILAAYSLGQVGTDWQFVGLGGFNGND